MVRWWNYLTRDSIGSASFDMGLRPVFALSPDGETLATISTSEVHLWRTDDGSPIGTLSGHTESIYALAFRPSGDLLATAGRDATVRFWDPAIATQIRPPLEGHEDDILALAFSADGKWLASAGEDATVRFWEVPGGHMRGGFIGHRGTVRSVAFSPDGSLLATGGDDGVARIWALLPPPDTSTDVPIDVEPFGEALIGHDLAVTVVAFAPGSGRLLATGSNDGTVRLWDVATQRWLGPALDAYRGYINDLAFSRDGRVLATASPGGVRLWPLTTAGWTARACRLAGRNLPARLWARLIPNRRYTCTCMEYPPDPESGLANCEQ